MSPVGRLQRHDLAVVVRRDVGAGLGGQHRKGRRPVRLAFAPDSGDRYERPVAQRETVLALGVTLSRDSKKAEAGIRQRLLFAKFRPSERKLNTGFPPGRDGGKLKFMEQSSTTLPEARMTGPWSLMRTSSACGSSVCCVGMPSSILHHLAVFGPANMLLVVITHPAIIASLAKLRRGWAPPLRGRAGGCAEAPRAGLPPFGLPSLTQTVTFGPENARRSRAVEAGDRRWRLRAVAD